MEGFEMPATVVLEVMMKKMQLPPPAYLAHTVEEGQIIVRVVFYPSEQRLHGSLGPQSFSSCPSKSTESAANNAAIEAIKYMESVERKVVKNFSYIRMEENEKKTEALVQQLQHKEELITKITKQLSEVTKSYDDFIDSACDFSRRIHKITAESLTPETTAIHNMHNATLIDMQDLSTDFKHLAFESAEKLKAIDTDNRSEYNPTEDEHFTTYSDSDLEHLDHSDCEVYNYDSDGLPLGYYGSDYGSYF